uniref:Uncharacterized protein n=1 Tax=Solanum lycopersicum TaxID=4081 RepID=A0A3Q7I2U9_SOLLC
MDSSMCSLTPDPMILIIQDTLVWRTPPVLNGIDAVIRVISSVYPTFDTLVESVGDQHDLSS